MESLGSLEPEVLFQLFIGSLSCAFLIFVLTVGYVLIARAGKKARKRTKSGVGRMEPRLPYSPLSEYGATGDSEAMSASPALLTEQADPGGTPPSVDVSARLAGMGREAWLEEVPAPADEAAPHHGKEVLRVVRDPGTDQVWVQVAGMRYRDLNEIRDRAVGYGVLAAITHLLRFTDGLVATDEGVKQFKLPACGAVKVPAALGVLSDARDPGEILRLFSDPERGEFCVHVVGRCYHRLVEVSDQAIGQTILETTSHLLQFSHGMLATDDGLGTMPVPSFGGKVQVLKLGSPSAFEGEAAVPTPASSGLQFDSQQPVTPVPLREQERFLQQLMRQSELLSEETRERRGWFGGRRGRKKSSAQPLPGLNLAEEINRIFQSKLALSPLAKTDAEIESDPEGGIRIRVGTTYYATPDEVPDASLRDMLKRSIADWEQS